MKIIQHITDNKLYKIIQVKNNRNRAALRTLRRLGFSLPDVRRALIILNNVKVQELGNGEVSSPTLYSTLKGARGNGPARNILAASLGLEVKDLFPENGA